MTISDRDWDNIMKLIQMEDEKKGIYQASKE